MCHLLGPTCRRWVAFAAFLFFHMGFMLLGCNIVCWECLFKLCPLKPFDHKGLSTVVAQESRSLRRQGPRVVRLLILMIIGCMRYIFRDVLSLHVTFHSALDLPIECFAAFWVVERIYGLRSCSHPMRAWFDTLSRVCTFKDGCYLFSPTISSAISHNQSHSHST